MNPTILRVDARATVDGDGTCASPGSVLIEAAGSHPPYPGLLLAAGATEQVKAHPASAAARVIQRPDAVLIPGLVNAHTHLDLTHIGPQPFLPEGGFQAWIDLIRTRRATDPEAIAEAVRQGVRLSVAGGVVAVGDIAGAPMARPTLIPGQTLGRSPILGTAFVEFFAMGTGTERSKQAIQTLFRSVDLTTLGHIRLGLQPHAPTTVEPGAYGWAAASGLPLSTHLAETPDEHEFIATASGPQRAFLERLGLWDDRLLSELGRGMSPSHHLGPFLRSARGTLVAHVNDASDADLDILAESGAIVVYCPRASAYFGAEGHFGPHRYREMLAKGIPVAIGTDSLVNLPAAAAESAMGGMSTLDEIRFLYRRDGMDPVTLLRLVTIVGAAAVGLDPEAFCFGGMQHLPRPIAGLVAVPVGPGAINRDGPAAAVAGSVGPVELLFGGIFSHPIGTAIRADS